MPASSLFQLAKKGCAKNIKSIVDVGDIPYNIIRPVLLLIENPEQLRDLEITSPQIRGLDAEVWMKFIKRDIPNWQNRDYEPSNPQNWYKVYKKLLADATKEIEDDANALAATLQGIKTEQAKHTIRHVHPSTVPKLPKMGGMIYATSLPQWKKPKKPPAPPPIPSQLNFGAGSRTKTLTGAGVISKARKEAQQLSMFTHKNSKLAMPTHELSNKASGVHRAPDSITYDYKHPAASMPLDPTVKKPAMFVPKRKVVTNPPTSNSSNTMTVEERERRLKAFTNPGSVRTSSSSTSSQLPSTTAANPPKTSKTKVLPTTETSSSTTSPPQTATTNTQTKSYRVPRIKSVSPEAKAGKQMVKIRKAAADPFMPAKRRKLS